MKEIKKITAAVEYIAYHLSEYKNSVNATKATLQDYLDKAWALVEKHEASEDEALHIRDLGRLINMVFDSDNQIVF